jgi:hypothetical protein
VDSSGSGGLLSTDTWRESGPRDPSDHESPPTGAPPLPASVTPAGPSAAARRPTPAAPPHTPSPARDSVGWRPAAPAAGPRSSCPDTPPPAAGPSAVPPPRTPTKTSGSRPALGGLRPASPRNATQCRRGGPPNGSLGREESPSHMSCRRCACCRAGIDIAELRGLLGGPASWAVSSTTVAPVLTRT